LFSAVPQSDDCGRERGIVRVTRLEQAVIPVPAREYEPGPYRLRHGEDAVWPPATRAYGGKTEETRLEQAVAYGRIAARLFVPVLLLLTLMFAVYLYADAPVPAQWLPGWASGFGLGISDLVLPGCWTVIHLTNRRFGPAHAFGHLVAGLVLALGVALINPGDIRNWLPDLASLSWRAVIAFFVVFGIANFVAIVAFDAARGPRWWTAPLVASLTASFVYAGLYYLLAFGSMGLEALAHFVVFAGVSVALLLPYCLLRPAMKPLNGMNGY
jgi:uncharacterized PurR-regulated membrane protein YhhQ (DUF165 family)